MGGHTHPALTGPPDAGGRLIGGAGAVAPRREAEGRLITQTVPWGPLFANFPTF